MADTNVKVTSDVELTSPIIATANDKDRVWFTHFGRNTVRVVRDQMSILDWDSEKGSWVWLPVKD